MGETSNRNNKKVFPGKAVLVLWSLMGVNFSQLGWSHFLEGREDIWFILIHTLMGLLASASVFLFATNWRGWGRRLGEMGPGAPTYVRPRSMLADILGFVAPLLVVANTILLILVLIRW